MKTSSKITATVVGYLIAYAIRKRDSIRIPNKDPGIKFLGVDRISEYMTEDEARSAVEFFLEENGLDIYKKKIRICIRFLPKDTLGEVSDGFGTTYQPVADAVTYYPKSYSKIRITVGELLEEESKTIQLMTLLELIVHELDHVLWAYENKGKFRLSLPYYEREHEKRAHDKELYWGFKLWRLLNGLEPT